MLSLADVRAAAGRLDGVAHRTPVLHSRRLDERVGAEVYVKAECFQRTGSFKFRGAYNALASLTDAERARGVVTASSGNHAAALALAARMWGTAAVIVMPHDAPANKRAATEGYGGEIVAYDRYREDREAISAAIAQERSLTLVPPYDHWDVMAGQGTLALELFEDVGDLDALVVCVGGGGLIAGCATAAAGVCPGARVVGVEPAAGDDTRRSLAAGRREALAEVPRSIADGQLVAAPGRLTFEVNRRLLHSVVTVTDAAIVEAMALLSSRPWPCCSRS
jgi:threo-3-hydroxy-L-aspartate ammonia-lyase